MQACYTVPASSFARPLALLSLHLHKSPPARLLPDSEFLLVLCFLFPYGRSPPFVSHLNHKPLITPTVVPASDLSVKSPTHVFFSFFLTLLPSLLVPFFPTAPDKYSLQTLGVLKALLGLDSPILSRSWLWTPLGAPSLPAAPSVMGLLLIKEAELQSCQEIPCKVLDMLANAQRILETAKPFVLFQRHKLIPTKGLLGCALFSATQPASPTVLAAVVRGVLQSTAATNLCGGATAPHEDPSPWGLALA